MSFTRWGRTECPGTGETQLLYEGLVAGSRYNEAGNAGYLCLHKEPQFLQTTPGLQSERGRVHGTEYLARESPPAFSDMARSMRCVLRSNMHRRDHHS